MCVGTGSQCVCSLLLAVFTVNGCSLFKAARCIYVSCIQRGGAGGARSAAAVHFGSFWAPGVCREGEKNQVGLLSVLSWADVWARRGHSSFHQHSICISGTFLNFLLSLNLYQTLVKWMFNCVFIVQKSKRTFESCSLRTCVCVSKITF